MLKTLLTGLLFTSCCAMSWLHLSDIHVDMRYKDNAPNKCVVWSKLGTMCCRDNDIAIGGSEPCSKYGDLSNDVPPLLVTSVLGWVGDNLYFDFIINTGDDGSHKDVNQVFSNDNADSIHFITDALDSHFPSKPSYRVMGNHDSYWNVDQTFPGYSRFVADVTNPWKKWINDSNMGSYGYYSHDLDGRTKLVVMNSLFYDAHNLFQINDVSYDKATGNQIAWLENELNTSKDVLFLNHIPMTSGESNEYMKSALSNLTHRYSNTITATLNGHSHRSRFELYKVGGIYVSFALINPSIYTDGHYPMFRKYTYEEGVLDFEEYVCNISAAVETNNFTCTKEYSFLEEYSLTNIDLPNLVNLYERMQTNGTLLDMYITHYSPPELDMTIDYLGEIVN